MFKYAYTEIFDNEHDYKSLDMGKMLGLDAESFKTISDFEDLHEKPVFCHSFASTFLSDFCSFVRKVPSYGSDYDVIYIICFALNTYSSVAIFEVEPSDAFNYDEAGLDQGLEQKKQLCINDGTDNKRALAKKPKGLRNRLTGCFFVSRVGGKLRVTYIYKATAKKVKTQFIKLLSDRFANNPLIVAGSADYVLTNCFTQITYTNDNPLFNQAPIKKCKYAYIYIHNDIYVQNITISNSSHGKNLPQIPYKPILNPIHAFFFI